MAATVCEDCSGLFLCWCAADGLYCLIHAGLKRKTEISSLSVFLVMALQFIVWRCKMALKAVCVSFGH